MFGEFCLLGLLLNMGFIGVWKRVHMRLRSAFPPPPHGIRPPDASKVSTVTGMGPLGVAIRVIVIVFDA